MFLSILSAPQVEKWWIGIDRYGTGDIIKLVNSSSCMYTFILYYILFYILISKLFEAKAINVKPCDNTNTFNQTKYTSYGCFFSSFLATVAF